MYMFGIDDVGGHNGQIQNNPNGIAPDGPSGILRVTQDGQLTHNPTLGTDTIPLSLYWYMLMSLITTIIKKCVGNNGDMRVIRIPIHILLFIFILET